MRETRPLSRRSSPSPPALSDKGLGCVQCKLRLNLGLLTQKGIHWKVISSSETWLEAERPGLNKARSSSGLGSKDLSKGLWQKLSGERTTQINELQPALPSLASCPRVQVLGEVIRLSDFRSHWSKGEGGANKRRMCFLHLSCGRCLPGFTLPKRGHKMRRGCSQKEIGDLLEKGNRCWTGKNDQGAQYLLR